MPLPVTDLFKILSVFGNVLFVLYQLVVHLLDQEGSLVAKLWQVHDSIFYQVETVDLVLYTHIEWCSDRSFFLISMNRNVMVVTSYVSSWISVGYPWNAKITGLSFVKIASYSASLNP